MSPSEALEKLKSWQESKRPLKLTIEQKHPAPEAKGRLEFTEVAVTIESLERGRLRLSYNGETEELDLTGATFAAVPHGLHITFPDDNRSIVLLESRRGSSKKPA